MQILITKLMDNNKKKRCVTDDLIDSRILKFTIEFDLV